MQALPAYRVRPLQVDEGCTAAHAVIEAMLKPTAHGAAENGQKREALSPGQETRIGLSAPISAYS